MIALAAAKIHTVLQIVYCFHNELEFESGHLWIGKDGVAGEKRPEGEIKGSGLENQAWHRMGPATLTTAPSFIPQRLSLRISLSISLLLRYVLEL